ncbi:MAG: outer membrane protein [Acidobacteriaceae bacterium]
MGKKFFCGLAFLFCPIFLLAQAISPVTPKRATITAGGYFSYGQTDYGQRHAFGPGAYADFDYHVWRNVGVGIEGEVRFLNFLTDSSSGAGISEDNLLGGPRVTYEIGRKWLPYVKFLAGGSRFHYPCSKSFCISNQTYNYTTFAFGGGVDYKLTSHITVRPVDFEYQHWSFPPTGLTPWVYSAGVSYRLF